MNLIQTEGKNNKKVCSTRMAKQCLNYSVLEKTTRQYSDGSPVKLYLESF